jgi:aryl-alcohol dehydrogenase-like predicted oxidoreductase
VHSVDPWTRLEETIEAMHACVTAGKVRYVGCSNFEAWRMMKALGIAGARGMARFASVQLQYSLLSRAIEREHVPLCVEEGVAILPYGALAAGLLTGKIRRGVDPPADSRIAKHSRYRRQAADRDIDVAERLVEVATGVGRSPSQLALAWVAARPGVTSVIIGARTVEQIVDNLGAVGLELDGDTSDALDEVSREPLGYPYTMARELEAFVAPDALRRA